MSIDFFMQVVGCTLLIAFTVIVINVAFWVSQIMYDDYIERRDLRRWKKRTIGKSDE